MFKRPSAHYGKTPEPETPYQTRRPGLGRAHRLGARPGEELAAHGLRLAGPVRRLRGGARLAIGARHDRALGGRRSTGSARRRRSRRPIADYRPTDPQIAFHLARFIEQVRSIPADADHRAAELAARLRLHDRPRRGGAQRLCAIQRPVHQGRQAADRGRCLQRHPRVARQLPRRLDRAPLRERPARRDRPLDRHPHHRRADAARRRPAARQPARNLRQRHQLVDGSWGNEAVYP